MKSRIISFVICILSVSAVWAQKQDTFTPEAFHVEVTDMFPLSYDARYGLNDFSLTIRNDSALICMPYIGEAYVPSFTYDGLRFEHKYSQLKTEKAKDGIVVTFSVKHGIVENRFTVTAYPNHKAYITVVPSNAQSCSYAGEWSPIMLRGTK